MRKCSSRAPGKSNLGCSVDVTFCLCQWGFFSAEYVGIGGCRIVLGREVE